jgi:hypothetical protein
MANRSVFSSHVFLLPDFTQAQRIALLKKLGFKK